MQLESMLENHLMNDLDEDLVFELDEVVRANQLACLPFAKSERAELLLHGRHPSLAGDIDEERQRRLRDMAFRAHLKDDESRLSASFRARVGSLDDLASGSPSQEKQRRKSKGVRNEPFSPIIRPKDSTVDLMFDMEDDEPLGPRNPKSPALNPIQESKTKQANTLPDATVPWQEEPGLIPDEDVFTLSSHVASVTPKTPETVAANSKIWSSPGLSSSKLNMKEIMAQASSSRTSNLSMSLSVQKTRSDTRKDDPIAQAEVLDKATIPKLSQKERKKQQQQQALQNVTSSPQINVEKAEGKPSSPWQVASTGPKTSLKDVLKEPTWSPGLAPKSVESPVTSRPLTVRRTASPDTRFSGQQRSNSASNFTKEQHYSSSGPSKPPSGSQTAKPMPHSKSYIAPASKAEPSLMLSMSDIIGQQRREQEVIKEAVAKRSLQEIQEEQAFQEWWDQESRRAQEEEAARSKGSASGTARGGKSGGGRGKTGNRGRGGKSRGESSVARGRGRGKAQEKGAGTGQ